MEKSFDERVYEIVRQIPPGFVLSYGRIAHMLGNFSGYGPRAVGGAMRRAPGGLPCHRVVHADGSPALINGFDILLRMEGVRFLPDNGGKIDLQRHLWRPDLELFV